jgi:D-alanyl-lipoteichoic acid acyltransferase DltB (MBOAT superfamily)
LNKNRKYTNTVAEGKLLPSIKEIFQMLLTFCLVVIGWVFFRANSIGDALAYLRGMTHASSLFSFPRDIGLSAQKALIITIPCMLVVEWLQRNKQHGLEIYTVNPWLRRVIYSLIIVGIVLFMGKNQQFIYFQF